MEIISQPFTIYDLAIDTYGSLQLLDLGSVHQVPITAGWIEAVLKMKFAHVSIMTSTERKKQKNYRPSDLESNALFTWSRARTM